MIKPQRTLQNAEEENREMNAGRGRADLILIHQLQLPDLSDRQKAEILADFLSGAIHLNVHCGEDFQTLVAEEMAKLSDEDEED